MCKIVILDGDSGFIELFISIEVLWILMMWLVVLNVYEFSSGSFLVMWWVKVFNCICLGVDVGMFFWINGCEVIGLIYIVCMLVCSVVNSWFLIFNLWLCFSIVVVVGVDVKVIVLNCCCVILVIKWLNMLFSGVGFYW